MRECYQDSGMAFKYISSMFCINHFEGRKKLLKDEIYTKNNEYVDGFVTYCRIRMVTCVFSNLLEMHCDKHAELLLMIVICSRFTQEEIYSRYAFITALVSSGNKTAFVPLCSQVSC